MAMVSQSPSCLFAAFMLTLTVALVTSCREEDNHLAPIQQMAYGVKPAVVRVNAYATAEFHYDLDTLEKVRSRLELPVAILDTDPFSGVVETGAGGSGSGFIIHPSGSILTNAHVVEPTRNSDALFDVLRNNGAIAALMKHFPVETLRALSRGGELGGLVGLVAGESELVAVNIFNRVELSNGDSAPFVIRSLSPSITSGGSDLAILQIDRADLPTLSLGDSDEVRQLEEIWVVGYPAVASSSDDIIGGWLSQETDLEATFNPGTITAIKLDVAGQSIFQTDAPLYHGNSGGPAVNRHGLVIGVPTWGHTTADTIKFLVPINVAVKFLADAGVAINQEGRFNIAYRNALSAAAEGRWAQASANLELADEVFPNSPDLARFLRDAERGSDGSLKVKDLILPIGIGILLVAAVLVSRRRRPAFPSVVVHRDLEIVPRRDPHDVPRLTHPDRGTKEITPPLGRFTILNGERAGERLGLGGSGIRVGRESAMCEIVFSNPKVSRLHAEIVSIDGRITLIDRNSSNGTYVNDRKIDQKVLEDGDIIYFGGRNAVAVAYHS